MGSTPSPTRLYVTWLRTPAAQRRALRASAAVLILSFGAVLATRAVPFVTIGERRAIGIYGGPSPVDLAPAGGATNPVLTTSDVTDVSARFVADPFLFRKGADWFLFFEVFDSWEGKGVIGLARSADGLSWRYSGVVLSEPFALSYPYVFETAGQVYMLPGTSKSRSVTLYRARQFPDRWELVGTLVEGEDLAGASIFERGGRWWILAGRRSDDSLVLFSSVDLAGPWRPHPRNPVPSARPHGAGSAGHVIVWNGRLLRFAREEAPRNGTRVFAYEIEELSETKYRERLAWPSPVVGPGSDEWNAGGMHHVDAHLLPTGRWLAAVDGSHRQILYGLKRWP